MIVILEGLERSGKTTVANELENVGFVKFKDFNHILDYNPATIANRLDATYSMLKAMDKKGINVVLDRFHISEMVYSEMIRGSGIHIANRFFDSMVSQLNVVLVLTERVMDESYVKALRKIYPTKTQKDFEQMQDMFKYLYEKSEIVDKARINISENGEPEDTVNWLHGLTCTKKKYDFYLASPFFNDEQIKRMEKVRDTIRERGYTVYSPMEHGIVGSKATGDSVKSTFQDNINAIKSSKRVLAITDGKDVGTIWEAGYAYGIGIPVVYYAETLGDKPFNIMLAASGEGVLLDVDALFGACCVDDFTGGAVENYE